MEKIVHRVDNGYEFWINECTLIRVLFVRKDGKRVVQVLQSDNGKPQTFHVVAEMENEE